MLPSGLAVVSRFQRGRLEIRDETLNHQEPSLGGMRERDRLDLELDGTTRGRTGGGHGTWDTDRLASWEPGEGEGEGSSGPRQPPTAPAGPVPALVCRPVQRACGQGPRCPGIPPAGLCKAVGTGGRTIWPGILAFTWPGRVGLSSHRDGLSARSPTHLPTRSMAAQELVPVRKPSPAAASH